MSRSKYCMAVAVLAAVYLAAGRLGLSLAYVNASASAVWPPTGVALAALLLFGRRLWPGVFLGAFLANLATQGYIANDIVISAGNTLEAVIGARLVERFAGGRHFAEQAKTVFAFVLFAAVLSTAISATIGATTLCLGKEAAWTQYPEIWVTWWLGDMMGNLVIAPLLIICSGFPRLGSGKRWEALACFLTIVIVDLVILLFEMPSFAVGHFKYIAFLPILWAAFRFKPPGAVLASFLTDGLALMLTLQGRGPFASADPNSSLLSLQIYAGALTLTGLAVGAVVRERQRAGEQMQSALDAARRSEHNERARAAELETIMHAVPAVVLIARDPACSVITGNPAACQFLGLSPDANASKSAPDKQRPTHFDLFSGGTPLRPEELPVQRASRGEIIRDFEEEVRFRDGSSRFLLGNASPIRDSGGKITGAIAAFVDVTDRKKAEEALRAREANLEMIVAERTLRLRETVNELQTLSYSIAHDMRAPLRAMSAFAELLIEEASALSPQAQDYCHRIMVGADRLDRLIQDALSYTKTVLQEIPLEPVDVGTLLRGLIDTYPNFHAENARIEITADLPTVLGNEALLTQCLANLLGNAVKFVADGTSPHVRISAEQRDGHAIISVQDNGIGIAKEHYTRLFGMFQKLDHQYDGTGIGLAIVRKAAEKMRGEVGVESAPGSGSRFWIRLPLWPVNSQE